MLSKNYIIFSTVFSLVVIAFTASTLFYYNKVNGGAAFFANEELPSPVHRAVPVANANGAIPPDVVPAPTEHTGPSWKTTFSNSYPVGWVAWNGATLVLTKVVVSSDKDPFIQTPTAAYDVNLSFKVTTGQSAKFCTSYFPTSLRRVKNEQGDLDMPVGTTPQCIDQNSSKDNVTTDFWVPLTEAPDKQFIIQAFDKNGELQTFFTLTLKNDSTVKVEPAPIQG